VQKRYLWLALAGGITAAIFGCVATVLLRLLPEPRAALDYLVAGTLATLAALATIWILGYQLLARSRGPGTNAAVDPAGTSEAPAGEDHSRRTSVCS